MGKCGCLEWGLLTGSSYETYSYTCILKKINSYIKKIDY